VVRPKECAFCREPLAECVCDDGGLISLNPPPPVPYDGPIHDADG
jgi:hypothetical protein